MTKLRKPQSFEAALDKIRGDLTRPGMAAAVGKSESLVQQWTDPDIDQWPDIIKATQLDIAWLEQGHRGAAPIFTAFQAALGCSDEYPAGNFGDVRDELLDAQRAIHQASDKIRDAVSDRILTPTELRDIEQHAAIVKAEIDEAIAAAKHECAGPRVVASDTPAEAAE